MPATCLGHGQRGKPVSKLSWSDHSSLSVWRDLSKITFRRGDMGEVKSTYSSYGGLGSQHPRRRGSQPCPEDATLSSVPRGHYAKRVIAGKGTHQHGMHQFSFLSATKSHCDHPWLCLLCVSFMDAGWACITMPGETAPPCLTYP